MAIILRPPTECKRVLQKSKKLIEARAIGANLPLFAVLVAYNRVSYPVDVEAQIYGGFIVGGVRGIAIEANIIKLCSRG